MSELVDHLLAVRQENEHKGYGAPNPRAVLVDAGFDSITDDTWRLEKAIRHAAVWWRGTEAPETLGLASKHQTAWQNLEYWYANQVGPTGILRRQVVTAEDYTAIKGMRLLTPTWAGTIDELRIYFDGVIELVRYFVGDIGGCKRYPELAALALGLGSYLEGYVANPRFRLVPVHLPLGRPASFADSPMSAHECRVAVRDWFGALMLQALENEDASPWVHE